MEPTLGHRLPYPRRLILPLCALLTASSTFAQDSKPSTEDLLRYDKNKDGVLDATELATKNAAESKAASTPVTSAAKSDDGTVELSPFEVTTDNNGYYASNTMSGTRLNSKLEDLGASISVVTKQQMQDLALLDVNDIFLYEANTEGIGNFTSFDIDRNGNVVDNVAGNPQGANRVRGIGAANTSSGGFGTSGRTPIDPINIDAVEISRGPNSSIFGLGATAGTVNIVPAAANFRRDFSVVEGRADSYGGSRASLDVNRVIIRNKLAIRASYVHQEDEYQREPSGSRSNRYNAMVNYQPFKKTNLKASFEQYDAFNRRPNAILPRDGVSEWVKAGKPTWDPVTWTVHRGSANSVVVYNSNQATETTSLGAGLESGGTTLYARSSLFINPDGTIGVYSVGRQNGLLASTAVAPYIPNSPSPNTQAGNIRLVQSAVINRATVYGPLAATIPSITDQSLYDWEKINIAAPNWSEDKTKTFTANIEQIFFSTANQVLAAQGGWFREDAKRYSRSFIGTSGEGAMVVYIDPNERLPDGRTNPYFLRPYTYASEPTAFRQPFKRDTFRAQLAYQLRTSKNRNFTKWLGDHSVLGYGEYKDTVQANYRFRDAITSTHTWLPAGTNRANGDTIARANYRYYLGDAQGQNVDYSPPAWRTGAGTYPLSWYNASSGQWVNENVTIGEAYFNAANPQRTANRIKTMGGITQNSFFDGTLVTTFGKRKDQNFNRRAASTGLAADGITVDYSTDKTWPENWVLKEGNTTQSGGVLKPFRNIAFINRTASEAGGFAGFVADAFRSLTLHYNQSDSFFPADTAQSLVKEILPNPFGEGHDQGASIGFFNGKLQIKYNQYKTTQFKSRAGDSGIIATRAARIDFAFGGSNDQFNLQRQATAWVTSLNPGWTADQINTAVASTMGVTTTELAELNAYPISETSDVTSQGKEIEVWYNPTRNLRSRVTFGEQETIDKNLSPNIQAYIDKRMPLWENIIDPRVGRPWFRERYGSAGAARDFLIGSVQAPYKIAQANEGKPKSQIRKYRVNVLNTVEGAAFSANKWVKRFAFTNAIRWEDKASIGYKVFATDTSAYDPNAPIYDEAHTYVDFGLTYKQKIMSDKALMRIQLNVRNAFEGGRLQPVGVLPDGTPHTYRIVDPRLFVLTTTFEL